MKQKNIFYITLLAVVSLLWSCSNEDEYLRQDPPVEDGYSVLKMRFEFPKPKGTTYAATDFGAHIGEKEIKSIAFITKTDDEGTPGQPGFKQGELNKFFSTEDLRSATGLYEPLDKNGDIYNTSIKVRSLGFGQNTEVAVIANYHENGLTQALMDLESWQDLSAVITPDATDNLEAPLLMFDHEQVQLASGATIAQNFSLSRIVARIDVINDASDTDPTNGFVLTSAQLVNPRKYGFLTPRTTPAEVEFKDKIETTTEFTEIAAANAPLNDPLKVVCLYTYETSNAGLHNVSATAVRVKGTYKGIQFDRVIPIKHPDKDGVTGAPIPLQRNYRYAINLKPSQDPTNVEWTVKVAQWDEGEEIQVKPPTPAFAIAGFTTDKDTDGATGWNAATKTYNFTNAALQGATATFKTVGKYATAYTVSLLYDASGKSVGLDTPEKVAATVQQGTPVVTYAEVEQTYTVNLPQQAADVKVPVTLRLVISSLGNDSYKDTIDFNIRPNYDNTALQPVLLGGKFWAPVNVGATQISTTSINKETTGNAYQWGRNQGYSPIWASDGTTVNAPIVQLGPVEYDECESPTGIYKDAFIIVDNTPPIDWLKKTDIDKWNYRNKRWSPEVNDSPCPKGWRLPTNAEIQLIIDRYSADKSIGWNHFVIGDKGDKLYLPRGGWKAYSTGTVVHVENVRGLFWTSEYNDSHSDGVFRAHSLDFHFNVPMGNNVFHTSVNNHLHMPSYAWHIRCIQQDVEDQHP